MLKSFTLLFSLASLLLVPRAVGAIPNGTWLSRSQIRYYASTHRLKQVLAQIRFQHYKVVFLDYRHVPEQVQQEVSREARSQGLTPVVWVQSPSVRISKLVYEARNGNGIQVDDHFFSRYTLREFHALRRLYTRRIFCSIQPKQFTQVPPRGCNQLDVQCYASNGFKHFVKLANRLGAVVSLSTSETLKYRKTLGKRRFNTFLWP